MRQLSCLIAFVGTLTLTLSTAAATSPAFPDTTIARQAQKALEQVAPADGPGVAILIARGNQTLYRGARGYANIELGVPLSADQVFSIASVTKMFTATLVLKLAENGKLSLDDPLSRYFPDFPDATQITIRQLLNHTAGISDKTAPKDQQPGFMRRDVDTATLITEIAKRSPVFAPGADQAYSNAGYILLGAVIEKVTAKPWYMALQQEILEPLDMHRTQYGQASSVIPGRIAGYTTDTPDHAVRNASFISMSIPAAAGGLVSTVDDLHLWMQDLTHGQVISEASYRQMIAPTIVPQGMPTHPYGMGMYVWHVRGETMIGHTGQINGFASLLGYIPSRDITIVALGNDDHFDARTFGYRLAAIALGKPYVMAATVPIAERDLQALVGVYRVGKASTETLSVKDGRLYAQRGSGNVVPLQMTVDGQLHFVPDELSYFVPIRSTTGTVTSLDYFENGDGPPMHLPRQDANE